MKKIDLSKMIGLADEKYIEEAAPISEKREKITWRRALLSAACITLAMLILLSVAVIPFIETDPGYPEDNTPYVPSFIHNDKIDKEDLPEGLRGYADSEYINLMLALYTYKPSSVSTGGLTFSGVPVDVTASMSSIQIQGYQQFSDTYGAVLSGSSIKADGGSAYVENTDNQVEGVIEADLLKRTKTHAFYANIYTNKLLVYSLDGEDSKLVSCYTFDHGLERSNSYGNISQIFLSEDGNTLTLIANAYGCEDMESNYKNYCYLVSLDVSNPADIKENKRIRFDGSYSTARLVDGKILFVGKYGIGEIDYDDPSTFLPRVDIGSGFTLVGFEDIVFPRTLTTKTYTLLAQVDEATLELEAVEGCLSFSNIFYVSKDKIFLTRPYTDSMEGQDKEGKYTLYTNKTEIVALSYGNGEFEKLGSISVAGDLVNQYSLDEYEGVLRAVTTTRASKSYGRLLYTTSNAAVFDNTQLPTNASLYCIDLREWRILASVKNFAPEGERVRSVRFDGTAGYVCTAEVTAVKITDPVYFFDLSNLNKITYTDTGTIEGYSSSLVNFGNGFLLGIGYGNKTSTLKIEVYKENGDKVESVCKFERSNTLFSTDYKDYFIDRENGLIGIAFRDNTIYVYKILRFDGNSLVEVSKEFIEHGPGGVRGVLEGDWFYVFSRNEFKFRKIFN